MFHGRYPHSEQAHKSPTNAPKTKQQERDHEMCRRHGNSVRSKVAWITREETHQEGDEIIGTSCTHSCQKAKSTADSYSAHHKTSGEADEEAEYESEEFQQRQNQCRLDGQPVHSDLQACSMKRPRVDKNDQDRE